MSVVVTCFRLPELQNLSTSDAVTDRVRCPDALTIPTPRRSRRCSTSDPSHSSLHQSWV